MVINKGYKIFIKGFLELYFKPYIEHSLLAALAVSMTAFCVLIYCGVSFSISIADFLFESSFSKLIQSDLLLPYGNYIYYFAVFCCFSLYHYLIYTMINFFNLYKNNVKEEKYVD